MLETHGDSPVTKLGGGGVQRTTLKKFLKKKFLAHRKFSEWKLLLP